MSWSFTKTILFFVTCLAFAPMAEAEPREIVHVGRGEMMSHEQFMRLNREQQKIYIKEVRTIFVMMAQKSDFFASNETRPSYLRWLIPQAEADESNTLRCMYGGFILKTDTCVPQQSSGSYTCPRGQAICNPLLFGDGEGSGLCLRPNRQMTAQCAQASSSSAQLDRAVAIAREDRTGWGVLSTDINRLCDANERPRHLRPGLSARSQQDIESTCVSAKERFTALAPRVNAVTQSPAPPPPPPTAQPPGPPPQPVGPVAAGTNTPMPPVAEVVVVAPPAALNCSGRCRISVVDVRQGGTGRDFLGPQQGRVNGYSRSTYSSNNCEIAMQAGSGGSVDMKNLPENFPDRLMSMRLRRAPCPRQLEAERCQSETAFASNDAYSLFARSSGPRQCELEFVAKGPTANGTVEEIVSDQVGGTNTQKCMGLPRDANMLTDALRPRFAAYTELTHLLASQGCDLVRPGADADWNGSQNALIRDCRLRMSPNLDASQPLEIRFRPSRGEALNVQVPNLREGFSPTALRAQLEANHICFPSWKARLDYRESQSRQPTARGRSNR
ncbi:MAG: hypothetical protein V4760_06250 [Bdellovibrionota bacterium]